MSMRISSKNFFFSSRRRHTRCSRDWSSDVCSSDLTLAGFQGPLNSLESPDGFVIVLLPHGQIAKAAKCVGFQGGQFLLTAYSQRPLKRDSRFRIIPSRNREIASCLRNVAQERGIGLGDFRCFV